MLKFFFICISDHFTGTGKKLFFKNANQSINIHKSFVWLTYRFAISLNSRWKLDFSVLGEGGIFDMYLDLILDNLFWSHKRI